MKKIISILACVCLLLSVMIVPVSAAETSVTITFDDSSKAQWSSEQQLWQENGITVTNNKASSTNNIDTSKKYSNPARFYKNSEVIIEYPGMTTIVVNANTAAYATALQSSCTEGTATASGKAVTIVLDAAVDSYTVTLSGGQVRVDSITVYTGEDVCAHDTCTYTSNGDETHTVVCDICGVTVSAAAECVDSDVDGVCDNCTGAVAIPFDPTDKTPAEIVEAAYALEAGETIENVTLTGTITSIGTAYNSSYKNISLTIAVTDTDQTMYCYRLTADEDLLETLAGVTLEDTITVTGTIGVYNGAPQFQAGAKMTACEKGDFEVVVPEDPKEIVDAAFALEAGSSLLYEATLEGEVVSIDTEYSETYGNITLTISVEGTDGMHNLVCYRLKAGEGADASTVKVGDVIAVTGNIKNYNGTIEFDTGCTFVMIESAEEETLPGLDPEAPIELAVNTTTEVVVPAGATVFMQAADATGTLYVTNATGSYMLINGMQNQLSADGEAELVLCGYEMVNVYNPSETDEITLHVLLEEGEGVATGTWENPEELVLAGTMWNPDALAAQGSTELEAENQGYFYKVVAPDDGAISISASAYDPATYESIGYQFSATNNNTSYQSELIAEAVDSENYYNAIAVIPVSAGDEVIINVGTYDAANPWVAPAGAINVNVSFDKNGSQNLPIILENTGAQETTTEAGSQGIYYKWVATADGKVTIIMNDETGWQYNVSKVPVDESDYANYYNSDTHWYSDDPVVATETVEVVAGETIKVWVNTFDPANESDSPAGTVNWTFSFTENVEGAVFSIADADAVAGKEFTVTIDISNNPGIVGAKLNINYDADILELVSAEAGDFTNGSVEAGDEVIPNYNFSENITDCPFVINWTDPLATENVTTNGTFAILTFKVKGSAVEGTTEISITFEEDDIVDVDLNNVAFEVVNSVVTITVEDTVSGDANGDGNINGRDYAMLLQYVNGWTVSIDESAADVNGDGQINGRDYAMLLQYVNGWDIELK